MSGAEFLIVVPTIRQDLPKFEETIAAIRSSFTRPTDFRVLDGSKGKVPALNEAIDEVLLKSDAPVYVTLDDDFVPPRGWQDKVARAFELYSRVGIVCPWGGESEEWRSYIGSGPPYPWRRKEGLDTRLLRPWRHIPGCLLAFRREVVVATGKSPSTHRRYDIWEDCWRGRMAYKLGWRSMYVQAGECEIVHYDDRKEYVDEKAADMDEGLKEVKALFAEYGISDPWVWRFHRLGPRLLRRARRLLGG